MFSYYISFPRFVSYSAGCLWTNCNSTCKILFVFEARASFWGSRSVAHDCSGSAPVLVVSRVSNASSPTSRSGRNSEKSEQAQDPTRNIPRRFQPFSCPKNASQSRFSLRRLFSVGSSRATKAHQIRHQPARLEIVENASPSFPNAFLSQIAFPDVF